VPRRFTMDQTGYSTARPIQQPEGLAARWANEGRKLVLTLISSTTLLAWPDVKDRLPLNRIQAKHQETETQECEV